MGVENATIIQKRSGRIAELKRQQNFQSRSCVKGSDPCRRSRYNSHCRPESSRKQSAFIVVGITVAGLKPSCKEVKLSFVSISEKSMSIRFGCRVDLHLERQRPVPEIRLGDFMSLCTSRAGTIMIAGMKWLVGLPSLNLIT